ncbi:MAG: hypothetical protein A2271_00985 [Candidatus Moranbacteria bacterium RIFOXYA12_FULL_35_19]|nr:MAG: hypothetical protein UR78_C0005G0041 [Candidatus Moranbacteria bacterium GW2011_GWF2_35_39]OGI30692.1 MAG: hypothetical protein A2343_01070 [Candidatus Moranbacteria bacterium RIFOXYB12_FULL_35_8]OGI32609.1 MAG: hypothetical protein A2489_02790 [Candidatus Moranbacteria bacterium RIFOXYC12_FULL_36_13]OGI36476.1 MAG: hypothetical protein A2271_00985 [Candidatus Moranbacteria bacterium RIFOXYA12_FULL_35_19]
MDNLISLLNSNGIDIIGFYNSTFFSVVKFILGIYAVVVFADIVLLLAQRGFSSGDIRETLLGLDVPPELLTRKGRLRKKWDKVREKIRSTREEDWKIAIISADNIIDDLIARMGYKGENMGERLAGINPGQIENIEELKKAHEFRNRIIHEENLKLTKEQAREVLKYFENFLDFFDVLK